MRILSSPLSVPTPMYILWLLLVSNGLVGFSDKSVPLGREKWPLLVYGGRWWPLLLLFHIFKQPLSPSSPGNSFWYRSACRKCWESKGHGHHWNFFLKLSLQASALWTSALNYFYIKSPACFSWRWKWGDCPKNLCPFILEWLPVTPAMACALRIPLMDWVFSACTNRSWTSEG